MVTSPHSAAFAADARARPATARHDAIRNHIAHPGLRRAVAEHLERERREVAHMGAYLEEHTPFRKDGPAGAG